MVSYYEQRSSNFTNDNSRKGLLKECNSRNGTLETKLITEVNKLYNLEIQSW